MLLGDLRIDLASTAELEEKGWELTGLNVKLEAYPPEHKTFISQTLNESQRLIREALLGRRGEEDLHAVCLPLLKIINREVDSEDERVTQAV